MTEKEEIMELWKNGGKYKFQEREQLVYVSSDLNDGEEYIIGYYDENGNECTKKLMVGPEPVRIPKSTYAIGKETTDSLQGTVEVG